MSRRKSDPRIAAVLATLDQWHALDGGEPRTTLSPAVSDVAESVIVAALLEARSNAEIRAMVAGLLAPAGAAALAAAASVAAEEDEKAALARHAYELADLLGVSDAQAGEMLEKAGAA